jgi:hypothetical protein
MGDIFGNWVWGALVTVVAVSAAAAMLFGMTAFIRGWRGEIMDGKKDTQSQLLALLLFLQLAGWVLLYNGMVHVGADPFSGGDENEPFYRYVPGDG